MTPTATLQQRQANAPISPLFIQRTSPYAFDSRPIEPTVFDTLFEAARWAPSSYNEQPWRFHLTTQGPQRDRLNAAILDANRAWSDAAPAIVWITAKPHYGDHGIAAKIGLEGQPNRHAWFDTGAAAMQLILQAHEHGLVTHAMGGIDADAAHQALGLDDEHVICALAIGYPGDPSSLPDPLRERTARGPSGRLPASAIVTRLQEA